jgi:PAP2 superfamily
VAEPPESGQRSPLRPDETIGASVQSRWSSPPGTALASLVRHTRTWAGANAVLAACLVVSSVLFAVLEWAAGEVYESVQAGNGIALIDRPLLDWILTVRNPSLDAVVAFYSNTGGPLLQPVLAGLVVVFLCWRWRSWTPLVLVVLAEAGALAVTVLGKQLVGRARPPLAESIPPYEYTASFPSGHTLNATVIAGIVCYLLLHWFRTRGVRTLAIVIAALYALTMGVSRVYLGHHWLTDVIAGWLIGIGWVAVVITLHRLWLTARTRHGEQRWTTMLTPHKPPQ